MFSDPFLPAAPTCGRMGLLSCELSPGPDVPGFSSSRNPVE